MIEVKKNLVPSSKYAVKCPYSMEAEFITFHNTANDATAENEIKYMSNNNIQVSYHFAVDDREVIQGLPVNRNAWHCGDGNGNGNRKSIGVEVCYSKSGGDKYRKAEELAIKFIAQLLHESNWGVDRVRTHKSWSGKNCPHRVLDEGRWNSVLNSIDHELKALKDGNSPSKPTPAPESKPSTGTNAGSSTNKAPQPTGSLGLVDWMKSKGMDSSFNNRAKLAIKYGIKNYEGKSDQNTKLLGYLQNDKKATVSKPSQQDKTQPKGDMKTTSIVTYLNSIGVNSSFENRKKLAAANGIKNYTGTSPQNLTLLSKLRGNGNVSTPKATSTPSFKVGGKVKIKNSAKKYATGQNIPNSVKGKSYTIQQIKSDRVLLKEIYSWVKKTDLTN